LCKAGWSCEAYPRLIFPSVVSRSKAGADLPYSFGGQDLAMVDVGDRGLIKTAFEEGVPTRIAYQELVLDHVFSRLGIRESTINHPIVFTEPLAMPNQLRQELLELLFDVYGVPAVCLGVDVLFAWQQDALAETVKPDGISLSFGHSATRIVPVLDGRPLWLHVKRYW
jgi:actin-related protein